jgi:hypothetical protein
LRLANFDTIKIHAITLARQQRGCWSLGVKDRLPMPAALNCFNASFTRGYYFLYSDVHLWPEEKGFQNVVYFVVTLMQDVIVCVDDEFVDLIFWHYNARFFIIF